MPKKIPLIGAHISIAGGLYKAFDRGESIGCTAMQIFTKSNRSWFDKKLTEGEINAWKERWKSSTVKEVVVHSSYLINIGAKTPETEKNSVAALKDELHRCQSLGIPYLVLHPGSHVGAGEEKCIKQIAQNLDTVLESGDGTTSILLETMAGQGTNVGSTFEQIAQIRSLAEHKKNIGVCLDTCHIFSAGYNIASDEGYYETMKKFDDIVGLSLLKIIHLNDSKTPCNSHKDRHEALGQGSIPLTTFSLIMNDKRLASIPKILETPSDDDMQLYASEIKLLKKMIK
jgi:deoxyribonuclease-4